MNLLYGFVVQSRGGTLRRGRNDVGEVFGVRVGQEVLDLALIKTGESQVEIEAPQVGKLLSQTH